MKIIKESSINRKELDLKSCKVIIKWKNRTETYTFIADSLNSAIQDSIKYVRMKFNIPTEEKVRVVGGTYKSL